MVRTSDVVVIGGGATGAGVARDLALRGVDVTLVDRGSLAGGTTGRSHGLLHSGARYAEADPAGASECIAENRILREIAPACIRDTGGYFLQLESDDPDYFDRKAAGCADNGIPYEVHDPGAVREEVPDVTDSLVRAMTVPDGAIFPSRLVAANAADAENHGASVLTDAPVTDVRVRGGQAAGVDVGGAVEDTVEADFVVNAAGTWAGSPADMAGVEVSMRPNRGVMIAVPYAGLGPVLNRCRVPDDGDIVVPHADQVVLGTTSVPVDDPDDFETDDDEIDRTVRECAAMLPPVADLPHDRVWWGIRPLYAPDEDSRKGERGISRDFFLLDHADDGVDRFASVVGGKLTTYRAMAEAVADHVCEHLGVDEPCTTAERELPYQDDAAALDEVVARYGGGMPTDADVVGVAP